MGIPSIWVLESGLQLWDALKELASPPLIGLSPTANSLITSKRWPNLEDVCDIQWHDVNSAGYQQKKWVPTEKPWGQGFVSSAGEKCRKISPVLRRRNSQITAWNHGKNGTNMQLDGWQLLFDVCSKAPRERASVALYLRKCGNPPIWEILVITWPYARPGIPM